eukprot:TRINITY_DN3255_c0_g2_i1.p2 TRINITY_DN3255_c0_g2~~TRINITY_DN3255_c0_g2_i1.p2  ORF type:complete len:119 (+),score=16.21 TRINITY_DN3255_c0_g2_i1:308-664(+)
MALKSSVNRPPTPELDDEVVPDSEVPEPTLQDIVNIRLIQSGEKERLKELLRERLIECGWRDDLKAHARAFTRRQGQQNVTIDELIRTITPRGRASVPNEVKAELLQRIYKFLMASQQ